MTATIASIDDILHTIQFGALDNNELNGILAAVKYRRARITQNMRRQLTVGDTVQFFSSRFNRTLQGSVQKVAIKYVTVRTTQGLWKVPASMLEVA
jgi:ASC-1-like (ASCH) protein